MKLAFVRARHALTKIVVILASCSQINGLRFSKVPLCMAVSRPGTQHVPTEQEHNNTVDCFSKLIASYGFTMTNGKLPSKQSGFITQAMLNSSTICKNFRSLDICMGGQYKQLVDFDCLTSLTTSEADASFYLRQLSMAEFFCGQSIPFIEYDQCMEQVSGDDRDMSYSNCTRIEWESCEKVTANLKCQSSIIESSCARSPAVPAFCKYQKIQLRMTGWDTCTDLPCSSRVIVLVYAILIVVLGNIC
ncbi:hypothetical protein Y032_0110g184 [Ancylostoma ceylanicum]|uniref:DUF19 domain-containing protein n=1 Tax=Ancylostoma ceylanicum TaxID=53326 RepID=A0A016TER1_9BILA|nr:hypothetical protein Y032_0110g184 [Ancylostoma ceylanicum]